MTAYIIFGIVIALALALFLRKSPEKAQKARADQQMRSRMIGDKTPTF